MVNWLCGIILVLEQVLVKAIRRGFISFVYLYKYNEKKLDIFDRIVN